MIKYFGFILITFPLLGADIPLATIPAGIPTTNDSVLGTQSGISKLFNLSKIVQLATNIVINVSPAVGLVSPIQTALNNIPAGGPQWGTNVTGALINLKSGDYYVSNTLFYSNTFPYFVRIVGDSLSTRIIWAGSARTNLMKFCGGGNPNGGLSLPAHVEIEHITFTSVTNDLISLLTITNESYSRVAHCNFTGWELLTNNLHGSQVSIDGPLPTQPPGNVGLVIGSPLSHSTVVEDCFFAGLATGLHNFGDHFYGNIIKSALLGIYNNGGPDSIGTSWPNTSPYSLGFLLVFGAGLNVNIEDVHFYGVAGGVMSDGGPAIYLSRPQWEGADHAIAIFNLASPVFITEDSISDDSIIYKVNHGPYSLTATGNADIRYAIWSKMPANITLDGGGNRLTNFAFVSGNHVIGNVIDAQSNAPDTNHIYIVGAGIVNANGTYTWKGASGSLVFWTNTTSCGIILDRTGGSVSLNVADAFEITNASGHVYGIDSQQLTIGGALLVPFGENNAWETLIGVTVPPTSSNFGTNYVTSTGQTPFTLGNYLIKSSARSTIPPQLPLESVWMWNSNGILFGIQTSNKMDGTTVRYTNKLW